MESRRFCGTTHPDCFDFDEYWNWTIFFTKFLDQRRIHTHANELKSSINSSKNFSEILQSISSDRFESLRVFTLPIRDSFSIAERFNGKDVETAHEVIHNGVQEVPRWIWRFKKASLFWQR